MPRFITDIDGTILDSSGQPIDRVIDFIEENAEEVIVLTNRPESERADTEAALESIGLEYDSLVMNGSGKPAAEFKAAEVKKLLDAGKRVDLFIDNDPDNRDSVRALGVEVMDPADIAEPSDASEQEDDALEGPGAVDRFPKIKMTLEEQLNTAEMLAQALTAERDDLRSTVEKLTVGSADELAAAKADASAKEAKVNELAIALETAAKETEALKAKVAELEAGKVSASKEAAKIAASVGVEPTAIIPGSDNVTAKRDVLAEFEAITDPKAKNDFFKANAQAIYASIKV